MLYSDDFLESLKHDPIAGVKEACRLALDGLTEEGNWTTAELEALEEADVLLTELAAAELLPVPYTLSAMPIDPTRGRRASATREALQGVVRALEKLELRANREKL